MEVVRNKRDEYEINIRPLMIYSKGSKQNYINLAGLTRKDPFFPDYSNRCSHDSRRSFWRFSSCMKTMARSTRKMKTTSELVKMIGTVHVNHVQTTRLFNGVIGKLLDKNMSMNKLFGDFAYMKGLSTYPHDYHVRDFFDSIAQTERHEPSSK